jgi:hypothetical protein
LRKIVSTPFSAQEVGRKIISALERAEKKSRNISAELWELVSVTFGDFSVTFCYGECQAVTRSETAIEQSAPRRFEEKGLIEKTGKKAG